MRRWMIRWISALAILAALVTSARSQPASPSPAPEVPAPQGGVPDYTRPRFEMVEMPAPLPSPLDAAAHETEVGVPQPTSSPATYKIVLGHRHACVIPSTEKFAGSEGGTIDVQLPGPE